MELPRHLFRPGPGPKACRSTTELLFYFIPIRTLCSVFFFMFWKQKNEFCECEKCAPFSDPLNTAFVLLQQSRTVNSDVACSFFMLLRRTQPKNSFIVAEKSNLHFTDPLFSRAVLETQMVQRSKERHFIGVEEATLSVKLGFFLLLLPSCLGTFVQDKLVLIPWNIRGSNLKAVCHCRKI